MGEPSVDRTRGPRHVAIILDGNGRWANARGLPRTAGLARGEPALFDVIEGALDLGIEWLTAYVFSTENWARDETEVQFLMHFNIDLLRRRDVIQSLMCNFRVDRGRIETAHGIDFGTYFAEDLDRLRPLVEEGLAEVDEREVRATSTGELFIRNIAMCFDAYLAGHDGGDRPVFSRTG